MAPVTPKKVFVPVPTRAKRKKLFCHKSVLVLPSGEVATLVASNNPFVGDKDFRKFHLQHKGCWSLNDGWAGIKLTPQKPEGSYGQKTQVQSRVFMTDIQTLYFLLKDKDTVLAESDRLCKSVIELYNKNNQHSGSGTRTVEFNVACREYFDTASGPRTYLMLIATSYFFSTDEDEKDGPSKIDKNGHGIRMQLKYMSNAPGFSKNYFKRGGVNFRKIDWFAMLHSLKTDDFVKQLENEPAITLDQDYSSKLSERLSDPAFLQQLEADLAAQASDSDNEEPPADKEQVAPAPPPAKKQKKK